MQESRAISGSSMLKTLIIATVLLPTLAIAQRSQQLPQPRQPGQWCPVGCKRITRYLAEPRGGHFERMVDDFFFLSGRHSDAP